MDREVPVKNNGQSAHRETVARYFSTKTEFWTVVYTEEEGACGDYMGFHMRRRRDLVLKCLCECQAQRGDVLDVGCGSGQLVIAMANLGHQVSGVDIAPGMVEEAQKCSVQRGLNPENIQLGPVETIPHEDNAFDAVTCVGVLEYVDDERVALAELKRILKDDGRIILTMPNLFKLQNILDPYYWFVRTIKYCARNKTLNGGGGKTIADLSQISTNDNYTNKRYSCRELVKIFADTELVPVGWVGLGYGPFTFARRAIFTDNFSKQVSDFLEKVFKSLPFFGDRYFANRWVICLQKKEK